MDALRGIEVTRLSEIQPGQIFDESRAIEGVVTIVWPYSILTKSIAFILAERDLRLRRDNGQLRIEYRGATGKAIANDGIGGGDEVRLGLGGAVLSELEKPIKMPWGELERQLVFTNQLRSIVSRFDHSEPELIEVNVPEDEQGQAQSLTENEALIQFASSNGEPLPNRDAPKSPMLESSPTRKSRKRKLSDISAEEFPSPAFLKCARLSYGSFFEDDYEKYWHRLKYHKANLRRSPLGAGRSTWRYSSRSTSPEDVERRTITVADGDGDRVEPAEHPETSKEPLEADQRQMVDEGRQTQEQQPSLSRDSPDLQKSGKLDEGRQTQKQQPSPSTHSPELQKSGESAASVVEHAFRPISPAAHEAGSRVKSPTPSRGGFEHDAGGESGGTRPSPPQQTSASASSQTVLPESAPIGHYRATPLASTLDAPSFHVLNASASSFDAGSNVTALSTTPLSSSQMPGSELNIDPSLQPSPLVPTEHAILHPLMETVRHDLPSNLHPATSIYDAPDDFPTHQEQWVAVNNPFSQGPQALDSTQGSHEEGSPSSVERLRGMNPEDEQAPTSEDGQDLPGEDYDLRNYDRTKDDDGESEVDPVFRSGSEAAGRDSAERGAVDPSADGNDNEENSRQSSNAGYDINSKRKDGSIYPSDSILLAGHQAPLVKAEYEWTPKDHTHLDRNENEQDVPVATGFGPGKDEAGYNEDTVGESVDEDVFDEDGEDEGESENEEDDEGESEDEDAADEDISDEDEMEDEEDDADMNGHAQLHIATNKALEPIFIDLPDSEDEGVPSKGAEAAISSASNPAPSAPLTVSQHQDQGHEEPTKPANSSKDRPGEEATRTSDQRHKEASTGWSRSSGHSPKIADEQAARSATAGGVRSLDEGPPPARTEELEVVVSHASIEAVVARHSSIGPKEAISEKARSPSVNTGDNNVTLEETLPAKPEGGEVAHDVPEGQQPQGEQSAGGALQQQPNDIEKLEGRENEEVTAQDDTMEEKVQSPQNVKEPQREVFEEQKIQDDAAESVNGDERSPGLDGNGTEQDHPEEKEQQSMKQGVSEDAASFAHSGETTNPPSQEGEQPEGVTTEKQSNAENEEEKTSSQENGRSSAEDDGDASGEKVADDIDEHKAGRELQVLISVKPQLELESERQPSENSESSPADAQAHTSDEENGTSEDADGEEPTSEQRTSSGGMDQAQDAEDDAATQKKVVGSDSSKKDQTNASSRVLRSMTEHEEDDSAAATAPQDRQASVARGSRGGSPAPREEADTTAGSAGEGDQGMMRSAKPWPAAAAEDGAAAEAEDLTTLKRELQKALRSNLPDFVSLHTLRFSLQKAMGVLAVSTSEPPQPRRPKNGPRDYMLELTLADPSIAPSGVVVAHIFRPHQASLPVVHAGDVVLLQRMQVVAVRDRGFGLRAGDASAWAVFEKGDEQFLPQIKGPPVEVSKEEVEYAQKLRKWWTMLDEQAMAKVGKATEKASQSRKEEQQ